MCCDAVRAARRRSGPGAARGHVRRPQRPADRRQEHAGPPLPAVILQRFGCSFSPPGPRDLALRAPRAVRPAGRRCGRRRLAHHPAGAAGHVRHGRGRAGGRRGDGRVRLRPAVPAGGRRRADRRLGPAGRGQGRDPRAAAPPRRPRRPRARSSSSSATAWRPSRRAARATICNMVVETGRHRRRSSRSTSETRRWLAAQDRGARLPPVGRRPRCRATTSVERIDLSALEPLVALPPSPGNVVPVAEVAGTAVVQVCVGSSVNSSYEDLATVAAMLRDRTVAPGVILTVTPGSRQILDTIIRSGCTATCSPPGARMLEPVLRAVHRHRAGAGEGPALAAHVQPQLPRPQRHRRATRSTSARPRRRRPAR